MVAPALISARQDDRVDVELSRLSAFCGRRRTTFLPLGNSYNILIIPGILITVPKVIRQHLTWEQKG